LLSREYERGELMAAFNFHKRQTRRWWYAGATLVAVAFFAVMFVGGASATLSGSPSNFESSDGNMTVEGTNFADWNCFANGKVSSFANPSNTTPQVNVGTGTCSSNLTYANASQLADPNAGTAKDVSWVSGQKMDLQCAKTTTGNNPAKDTFNNVAQYNETDPSTHDLYLYGASIRATANGNANENVELSQHAGTSTCPINRSDGDKLLLINFPGNNSPPTVELLTYYNGTPLPTGVSCFSTSTHKEPCWANPEDISSDFEGAVGGAIAANDNGLNQKALLASTFAEFGTNLSNALDLSPTTCFSAAQQTWESRSSSSFSSNPEDIEIFNQPITNCGSLLIYKTDGTNPLSGAVFTASPGSTDTSGVTASSSTFVDEGGQTPSYPGYYCLDDMLLGQSTTVHETTPPTGYNAAADQTITVTNTDTCATRLAATTITPDGSTFVDTPQLGALKVVKTAKNKNCTGAGTPTISSGTCKQAGVQYLSGVSFGIYQSNAQVGSSVSTGSDGVACFTNLPLGSYNVRETAPSNYQGAANHDVTVTASSTPASCSTGTPVVDNVSNTPLSKIEVLFTSSAGSGVTQATITCKDASLTTITPDSGSTSGIDQSYSGLLPNPDTSHNYTCTINIDP
jgi:hypothetical protein